MAGELGAMSASALGLDLAQRTRGDFPVLDQQIHGRPLIYLDYAATSQKPRQVLDVLDHYYRRNTAPVRAATICQGTRLLWCSITVVRISSPGWS